MKPYRVIVHGILAPVQTPEGLRERGFYTAREVLAASAAAAGLTAVALVESDPRVVEIAGERRSGALDFSVDEVVPLADDAPVDEGPQELIFYRDGDDAR